MLTYTYLEKGKFALIEKPKPILLHERDAIVKVTLEFAIFCIENVASRLHVDAQNVYVALSEQTNILNDYIIPEYEVLHTQSKDYIVDDIIDVMHERGVKL